MMRIYLSIICILFFSTNLNSQKNGSAEITIGDQLPSIKLTKWINSKEKSNNTSGLIGKALILDFWASWCATCVSSFPKIDTLNRKFEKYLKILPITYESKEIVEDLFESLKKNNGLTPPGTLVEDTVFSKLFKHQYFPHYVWIDKAGKVKAITGQEDFNESNIKKLIAGEKLLVDVKVDSIIIDSNRPLIAGKQYTPGSELLFHSVITGYKEGMPTRSFRNKGFISLSNHTILKLYQVILGGFTLPFLVNYNRVILEGMSQMDSIKVGMVTAQNRPLWKSILKNNVYTYEFFSADTSIPKGMICELALKDLNAFFRSKGFEGKLIKETVNIMALVRTSDIDKIATNGRSHDEKIDKISIEMSNVRVQRFVSKLQLLTKFESKVKVMDKTNYKGLIDISLKCDFHNVDDINKALSKYDLMLVEQEDEVEMIVISKLQNNYKR